MGLRYYDRVVALATQFGSNAQTAMDVGAGRTKILEDLTWIKTKVAVDLEKKPIVKDALNIQADFLKYQPKIYFDLVFCLQVLEHLPDPASFLQKLFQSGKTVIISVPYQWPAGFCEYHLQDPVDEAKVMNWSKKQWIYKEIVEDKTVERLILVFKA
jgi:hypothetical protein